MTFEELHYQCRRLTQLRTELLIRSDERPLTDSEMDLVEALELELDICETELVGRTPPSPIDIQIAALKRRIEELIGREI